MADEKKPNVAEDKPDDGQEAIHPSVDEGLRLLAKWVAEDIMKKGGINHGEHEE